MRHLVVGLVLTLSCQLGLAQQNGAETWVKTRVCGITFLLPPDMKNLNSKGVDSCVADFSNGSMSVMVDFGFYGGAHKQSKTDRDFNERTTVVDGRQGTVATYIDDSSFAQQFPERRYVVYAHVFVKAGDRRDPIPPMDTTLDFVIFGKTVEAQKTGERILRTLVFD
jgi:hypothetical protein